MLREHSTDFAAEFHYPVSTPAPTSLSAADVLALILADPNLSPAQRQNHASAWRVVTDLCKPEAVVASCTFFNQHLFRSSPAIWGLKPKRFTALLSYLRTILRSLGLHAPDQRGADSLPPAWKALYDALPSKFRCIALIGFMQYCGLEEIAPDAVTPDTLSGYEAWCGERIICADPASRARRTASNWNWAAQNVPGWPSVRLTRPRMRDPYTLPLPTYPLAFQEDVEGFLADLAETEDEEFFCEQVFAEGGSGGRSHRSHRGLRPRTIVTRRFHIRQAAAALVIGGIPQDSLLALRDLVSPLDRPRMILSFYRERAGRRPTSQLAGIGDTLRQIARYHCRLSDADVAQITEWKRKVTPRQQTIMNAKNARRLRLLMLPENRAKLLHYPAELMRRAAAPGLNPQVAARLALYAVAMEILLICPLRRGNLAELRLDQHLHRPDRKGLFTHIDIAPDQVKNGEPIRWPIPPASARLIETYLRQHRPHLAAAGNMFLFPGAGLRQRAAHDMAVALTEMVERDIGVEFNMHIMRHFAVWSFLRKHPGQYALVARVLGDKIATVMAFYAGLETDAAAGLFNASLQQDRKETRLLAASGFRRGRGRPPSPKGGV